MLTHWNIILLQNWFSGIFDFLQFHHIGLICRVGTMYQNRFFKHLSCFQSDFFHFEPQVWPCISYIQWLEVWKDYFRVQNDHKKDIVAWGPFFTNHGDTDTKHLLGLLLSLILIAEHYYTSKNTFKLEIKMFLR